MKKLFIVSLILIFIMLLASCGHEHNWVEANCSTPKICTICGKIKGQPLGHDWKEATCTEPKHCARCNLTEGSPLGHNYKTRYCSRCYATNPDYVDLSTIGFTQNINKYTYISIRAYSTRFNYVEINHNSGKIYKFYNNYFVTSKDKIDDEKYCGIKDFSSFIANSKTEVFSLVSNDVIHIGNTDEIYTITERETWDENVVIKIRVDNSWKSEIWLVPTDMLNFDTLTKNDDGSWEIKFYQHFFR